MRAAIFCCEGLGDGLISLVLAHNLVLNGGEVVTYHPFLHKMQELFPHVALHPFPPLSELATFDKIFIFYERSARMGSVITYCEEHHRAKTTILNPIATCKTDYPYFENGRFNGKVSFAENLYLFCQNILKLKELTRSNGILVGKDLIPCRFPKRVVIHPVSSRLNKNWEPHKFLRLAKLLEERGFEPVFVLQPKEPFAPVQRAPDDLVALARYIYESGFMIGNDSGIGHLASCLGLPTLTICRRKEAFYFWRPAWTRSEVVTPSTWIPNIKGLRLRDRHWQRWISVSKVLSHFETSLANRATRERSVLELGKKTS